MAHSTMAGVPARRAEVGARDGREWEAGVAYDRRRVLRVFELGREIALASSLTVNPTGEAEARLCH